LNELKNALLIKNRWHQEYKKLCKVLWKRFSIGSIYNF